MCVSRWVCVQVGCRRPLSVGRPELQAVVTVWCRGWELYSDLMKAQFVLLTSVSHLSSPSFKYSIFAWLETIHWSMGNPHRPCPKKNDSFHRSCQLPMAFQLRVGLVSSTFTVGILPGLTQCEPCVCFHSYSELMTTMAVSCLEDSEHLSLWLLVFHPSSMTFSELWGIGWADVRVPFRDEESAVTVLRTLSSSGSLQGWKQH